MKNLISISGNAGHGKDTVGKIIQWLLSGNAEGQFIEQVCATNNNEWWLEEKSGFEIKKFADKLKQIASILTGVPIKSWEDQSFKNETMPREWWVPNWSCEEDPFDPVTYRLFLQVLGTEAIRDNIHRDTWVNALFADYRPQKLSEYNPSKWIITDTRFPNELVAIKERGGITIKVVRTEVDSFGNRVLSNHIRSAIHSSENALDGYEFDHIIFNDDGIVELAHKVKNVLIKEGFLV
jgi:hypothetical protein